MCDLTHVIVMHQLGSAVDRHNRGAGRGVNHCADRQRSSNYRSRALADVQIPASSMSIVVGPVDLSRRERRASEEPPHGTAYYLL
ncbi:hypothetical protein Q1695_016046 [Nippostrongylus brasiliensis]|nr:hypothetical protein Q1695_016046 [Nippostrongylus brasiliensis]